LNQKIQNGERVSYSERTPIGTFTGRLLIIVIVAAVAGALWQLTDILMLLFGAILLAIGLRAAVRTVSRQTGMGEIPALAIVVVLLLVVFTAALWVFGSTVAAQLDEVIQASPTGFQLVVDWLNGHPNVRQFLEQARGTNVVGATGWATSIVATAVRSITRVLGYGMITFFVAIYLAAQPERYRRLCMRLVPPVHHGVAARLFAMIGDILRRWLIGQMVVMCTIGLLSGIGLWLLGIEAAFALGLMGGLLCFIPFVGAILAAVPATMVALTQGPIYAASVILMYAAIHFVEGNFITPMVQAEATSLPPVLTILSTIAFSILLGPSAVLLAAPLTLLLLITVEILYVREGLGETSDDLVYASERIRRDNQGEHVT
jgi:predicted PurR-regulated permease PerM